MQLGVWRAAADKGADSHQDLPHVPQRFVVHAAIFSVRVGHLLRAKWTALSGPLAPGTQSLRALNTDPPRDAARRPVHSG